MRRDTIQVPAGGSVTYTVVATLTPSASGTVSNPVSLYPPSGFTNTNPLASGGAVSATDRDTVTSS